MRVRPHVRPLTLLVCALTVFAAPARAQLAGVLKWRYDAGNTGWNSSEKVLNRTSVGSGKFGKLWERKLDGQVYAQPLYFAGVDIPNKGTRNVVYVATQHNTVYAFDADAAPDGSSLPLWQRSLGSSVPTDVVGCYDLWPEYGISSTPVINPVTKTMYVVAKTLENGQQVWRIHALDIATGNEIPGWGRVISGQIVNFFGTPVPFIPEIQHSRSALALANNRVYVVFGSHCDIRIQEYRGWIFSYSILNAKEAPQILCVAPDSDGQREAAAGIWSAGASPAFDAAGDMYFMTGNGLFNLDVGGPNMGDSFVRINTQGGAGLFFSYHPQDYFTPANQQFLTDVDADLGSGGLILLPPQLGANTPNLILGGGKDAQLRLLDRDNMGGFTGRFNPNNPNNVLQEVGFPNGFWSSPAYYASDAGRYIYMNAVGDQLRQYKLNIDPKGDIRLYSFAANGPNTGYPSSTPIVSSNLGKVGTGVVWLLNRADNALHAYDADNVGTELYNSNTAGTRDKLGEVIKFTVPMVANGRVFAGTSSTLAAFGPLADDTPRTAHYALAGPTAVSQGQRGIFQISSLDADGQPSKTTDSVSLWLTLPSGQLTNIGPIRFGGASSKTFYRLFDAPGKYVITAAKDTAKQITYPVTVAESATTGIDHFYLIVPAKVAVGVPFGFTVVAKDKAEKQVAYSGTVNLKFTKPDGTYLPVGSLVFTGQKSLAGSATLDTLGDSIFLATDGKHTGNALVTVKEPSSISGKAIPGDWVGHDRLKATIRLLDPADHSNVVFSKTVILEDDFSFKQQVPSGVFDISVKIDHWLQQIIKKVDTNSNPTVIFNGPAGTGMVNGDTNNDNKVDQTDVNNVQGDGGGPPSGTRGATDLNGDGTVDAKDLTIVKANVGKVGDK